MINGDFANLNNQTFFVSKEQSNCPLIPDIVRLGKKFEDLGLIKEDTEGIISLKYGKRLLINGSGSNFREFRISHSFTKGRHFYTYKFILPLLT